MSLLMGLLGCGVASTVIALILEFVLGKLISSIFSSLVVEIDGSLYYKSETWLFLYNIVDNFIGVALVEEGVKWFFLYKVTSKNPNFNCLFDGIIYAVFVSLGFAAAENVQYVYYFGFSAALSRAVTAVPGHMFFAVIMGCYYSQWRISELAAHVYRQSSGRDRTDDKTDRYRILSLLIPILIHGTYDFLLSYSSVFANVLFYGLVFALYVVCFRKVSQYSKNDDSIFTKSLGVLVGGDGISSPEVSFDPAFGTQTGVNPYQVPENSYPVQSGQPSDYSEKNQNLQAVDESYSGNAEYEQQTEFDVIVLNFDAASKIQVIKAVREITGLGLAEALYFVDRVPGILKEKAPVNEAETAKALLEQAGARVVLR